MTLSNANKETLVPKYTISSRPRGLRVNVTEAAGSERQLLNALQDCKEGRCSCPTPEYEKLATMDVTSAHGTVEIDLRTKPGAEIEADAVRKCLDYTIDQLRGAGTES